VTFKFDTIKDGEYNANSIRNRIVLLILSICLKMLIIRRDS
jgi:hypothetical protein